MTTLREAAQQALEILERLHGGCTDSDDGTVEAITVWCPEIIDDLRAALAEPTTGDSSEVEPVAWMHTDAYNPKNRHLEWSENRRGYLGDWIKTPLYAAPLQRPPLTEERNFCPRCGKRTNDIHTCTPPQEDHFCDTHCTWADHAPGCVRAEPVRGPETRRCPRCWEPMFGPQRKPLTEEEIRDLLEAEFLGRDGKRSWDDDLQVFRLAERAHKIGGEA